MIEHEFDHVFIWKYDQNPVPIPEEVMDFKWEKISQIKKDIEINTQNYTSWFKIILDNKDFLKKINLNYQKYSA